MLRFLSALFASNDRRSPIVHYHIDDAGHEVFCDESACRPTVDRHSLPAGLFPPFR